MMKTFYTGRSITIPIYGCCSNRYAILLIKIAIGGTVFLIGVIIMVYNLIKTAKSGKFIETESIEAAPLSKNYQAPKFDSWHSVIERKPVLLLTMSLIVVGIGGLVELVPTFLVKSNVPTILA